MDILRQLAEDARGRPESLKRHKGGGASIIGYTGRFVPEELIYAAGAEPYFICRGGEPEPAEELLPYMIRVINPYARAQTGYHLLSIEPVIPMLDLIVAECSDCHYTRLADVMEYFKLPTMRLGIPADWGKSIAFDYYLRGLVKLKEKLEKLTGNEISEEKLKNAVLPINKIRNVLNQISELRKQQPPPIGSYDFIQLNHYSFYCGLDEQLNKLSNLYQELKVKASPFSEDAPRLLLAGRVVAVGDYVLSKLIETAGGVVVAEFLDEGTRLWQWEVETEGDILRNIAETYFLRRTPPSIFQPAWEDRLEYLKRLIKDYSIDGVIWYQLSFEEIYDMECSIVSRAMDEMKMPFLKLESSFEYSREAMGPLSTRVESFIELVKMKRGD